MLISTKPRSSRDAYSALGVRLGFEHACDVTAAPAERVQRALRLNQLGRSRAVERLRTALLFPRLAGNVAYCRCSLYDCHAYPERYQPCYWSETPKVQ